MSDDLIQEITIRKVPVKYEIKKVKKKNQAVSLGMNQFMHLHWVKKAEVKKYAQQFMQYHFMNMPEMKYFDWEWSWGKSRFDNDNRQFFWMKITQDLLKGWKIEEDTSKFINKCTFYQNKGQLDDLKIRIYGERK